MIQIYLHSIETKIYHHHDRSLSLVAILSQFSPVLISTVYLRSILISFSHHQLGIQNGPCPQSSPKLYKHLLFSPCTTKYVVACLFHITSWEINSLLTNTVQDVIPCSLVDKSVLEEYPDYTLEGKYQTTWHHTPQKTVIPC